MLNVCDKWRETKYLRRNLHSSLHKWILVCKYSSWIERRGGSREGTQTGAGDFLISNTSITSQINIQWKQVSAARKVLQREISHFVIFLLKCSKNILAEISIWVLVMVWQGLGFRWSFYLILLSLSIANFLPSIYFWYWPDREHFWLVGSS